MDDAEAIASDMRPEYFCTKPPPTSAISTNAGTSETSIPASRGSLMKAMMYAVTKNERLAMNMPTFSDVPDCTACTSPCSRDDTSPARRLSKKAGSWRNRLSR